MKKLVIAFIILFSGTTLFAQNLNSAFKVGFQANSDASFGIVLKGGHIESAVEVQLTLADPDGELLLAGGYLAWLFNSRNGLNSFGIGVDFKNGFGSGIAEHVDMAARLSYNYHLSGHFMITGIFYPLAFSTRETEGLSDWSSVATIPSAAVACTVFF